MVKIADLLRLKIPFVLASSSPRRKKLLEMLGLSPEIVIPDVDEDNIATDVYDYSLKVTEIAKAKAITVANKINYDAIILGADTIVVLDGNILTKPIDEYEAKIMLKKLSNRTHIVFTGIVLLHKPSFKFKTCFRRTEVSFRKLEEDEIEAYVNSGSPLDKAGAYGIQDDFGAVFVKSVNGCYYNIVGLPLECFYTSLRKFINELESEGLL
ncbi:MAG: Septum formation protein Maf [Candidatus Kapaibacterium sp.]|nr:MAG: Septum formation protein Maf [Candidatus Kapabacteria bacterium]